MYNAYVWLMHEVIHICLLHTIIHTFQCKFNFKKMHQQRNKFQHANNDTSLSNSLIHRICESKHNLAPLCASIVMSHTSLLTSSPVITLFEHNHMCETPLYLVAFRSNPETLKAILSSANLATVFDINKQKGFFKSIGETLNLISFCFVLLIIMVFVYFRIFAFQQIVLI